MIAATLKHSGVKQGVALSVVLVLLTGWGWAQQPSSSSSSPKQNEEASDTKASATEPNQALESSSQAQDAPSDTVNEPPVRAIGKAKALRSQRSPLQWGSLSIRSVDFVQIFDSVDLRSGAPTTTRSASVLRTNVAYDKRFRRGRFTAQYQPRISVVSGRVEKNYSNQDVSFDTIYYVSQRWTMNIADQFSHYATRNLLGDFYLDADSVTGNTLQNKFLDGPGRLIWNTISGGFGYQLSARTSISFGPSFTYTYIEGSGLTPVPTTSHAYAGTVDLRHTLSPRSSVGASYSVQVLRFSRNLSNTIFHTVTGNYERQLTATTWFHGRLGVASGDFGVGSQGRLMTVDAEASLGKSFRRSSAWVAYSRGLNFNGYITKRISDRVDVGYGMQLSRLLHLRTSVGYYREAGGSPRVWGQYGLAELTYQLTPTLSLSGTYAHKRQHGDAEQILNGTRQFFAIGVGWSPGRRDQVYY